MTAGCFWGRRKNEPATGTFVVPGGRIMKNELAAAAFKRITRSELGIEKENREACFIGIYDHIYDTKVFERAGIGTHYVVLAYEIRLDVTPDCPSEQHDRYKWWSEEEILTSAQVHENTKAYFRATV